NMALKDIIAPEREIKFMDTSFTVGALDLTLVLLLLKARMPEAKSLFDEAKRKGLVDNPDPMSIALMLMQLAPDFVAEAVAMAAGEPDMADKVRKLPVGTQLEAIDAIMDLTFEAEGGVKKFGETLVRLVQKATQALEA